MNDEVQDLKEIIEVAIHVSSGLNIDKIIEGVVWFLYSKYEPSFVIFMLPKDMDDMSPSIHYYEGIEKKEKKIDIDSIIPLIEFFDKVEFNHTTFDNFSKSFTYKNITTEISKLKPNFLMPLKSDKGIVGTFMIGSKKNKKKYETEEIQSISYITRFTTIAIENTNLYRRATVDRMSKLYTHHHFQKKLEEEIIRCQRYNNYFSIILMDIDHFKNFNDTYGHLQGDIIIKEIAEIINTSIRNIDFPARYGGEEFAIILPQINGKDAFSVAERLRNVVKKHKFPGKNGPLHVTISVGVAEFDKEHVHHNSHIIDCADKALYYSKEHGRNKVTLGNYDPL